jgi:sarcosine oxidase subunit beta
MARLPVESAGDASQRERVRRKRGQERPRRERTMAENRVNAGNRFDVIVVGGGVVGCSTAYRLARRGRRVLLLEKRGIASGASGRNGGITGAGSSMHAEHGNKVYSVTSANWRLMQTIAEELGADIQLRTPGTFDVATTPEQLAHITDVVAMQQREGLDVHLLDRETAREMMPALSPEILGAEYAVERGHLWPFALVHAFADNARKLGAEIRSGVTVSGLRERGGRIEGVETDHGPFFAADVVLATNAWTPHLLDLPAGAIVPARGQILVTPALPPTLPYAFGTNFDKEYGRQTATGQILCGGYRRLDDDEGLGHEDEQVTPAVLAGIAQCLVGLFPCLDQVRVVRCWAGIMGFTADGLPLIGRWEQLSGLTVAAGFNGNGFSWAAITGQLVADLVTGQPPRFDLTPFDPNRFFTAGTVWANPFTAGEQSTQPVA